MIGVPAGRDTPGTNPQGKGCGGPRGHGEKVAVCTPQREAFRETDPASTLTLDLQSPDLWGNQLLFSELPDLRYFVTELELTNTDVAMCSAVWKAKVTKWPQSTPSLICGCGAKRFLDLTVMSHSEMDVVSKAAQGSAMENLQNSEFPSRQPCYWSPKYGFTNQIWLILTQVPRTSGPAEMSQIHQPPGSSFWKLSALGEEKAHRGGSLAPEMSPPTPPQGKSPALLPQWQDFGLRFGMIVHYFSVH